MSSNVETTSTSTGSELMKGDVDDGVVANETLVIDPVPSIGIKGVEKIPEGPTDGSAKDTGPPDGGYGWVVVMYVYPREELIVVRFVC
jgi:hypothetical protein